jgi:glycosyltransferase involved in cell wall biosynthesis
MKGRQSKNRISKTRVLVLTSTYPRWKNDVEPGFVHELCRRLLPCCVVWVLAPHFDGAALEEDMDGVAVSRFRYWFSRWQSLSYEGGIVNRIRENRWRLLLLPFFIISQSWKARQMVRRHDIQALHVHWLMPQGLVSLIACAGLNPRPRILCTSHGGDWYTGRGYLYRLLKLIILRQMDSIAVVSTAMANSMSTAGVDPGKIRVLPMGVDLRRRFAPRQTVERERAMLLFVGRLVEKKGLCNLIDAMALLHPRRPELRLVIAGWGPEEKRLRQQVEDLGAGDYIQFLGALSQEELPDWYARAAIAVFPFVSSRDGDQEGLGLVLIEALGCECPVISSDLPAVRDVVDDKRTGWLTKPGDSRALASVVEQCLDDPAASLKVARYGRIRVLARFDWDIAASNYAKALASGSSH